MVADQETLDTVQSVGAGYKYGFETEVETDYAPKGLNEEIVRLISENKAEPEWLLDWRLAAYERWLTMEEPSWAMVRYPTIDFQDQYYYAAPAGTNSRPDSLDDVDPAILATYEKLGIPLREQEILAGVREGAAADGRRGRGGRGL